MFPMYHRENFLALRLLIATFSLMAFDFGNLVVCENTFYHGAKIGGQALLILAYFIWKWKCMRLLSRICLSFSPFTCTLHLHQLLSLLILAFRNLLFFSPFTCIPLLHQILAMQWINKCTNGYIAGWNETPFTEEKEGSGVHIRILHINLCS